MNKLKLISAFAFALAFAGTSFAADEKIIGQYGAITIKNVDRIGNNGSKVKWTVAYIDDSSDETPVIPEDIKVDSVYYSRLFKLSVPSTLMLPFDVPTWKISGLSAFEFARVVRDGGQGPFKAYVRNVAYADTIKANTPYVIMNEQKDTVISFSTINSQLEHVTLNTSSGSRRSTFSEDGYDWTVIGTYERIEFKNPKGIYGFAAKNKNNTKMGDFKKAVCSDTSCAYIRPFRAYLKCSLTEKASQVRGLAKSADDVASLDDLPNNIEVHVIEENGDRTYLGTLNTNTGEITVEDRWFDMKGRRLQQKPTAKGTYFNNKKKVVIK